MEKKTNPQGKTAPPYTTETPKKRFMIQRKKERKKETIILS